MATRGVTRPIQLSSRETFKCGSLEFFHSSSKCISRKTEGSRACYFKCHAGKGFGAKVPDIETIGQKKGAPSQSELIADKTIKKMTKQKGQHPRIDQSVASQGRLDVVQVESWGKSIDSDVELGNLKVKRYASALAPAQDESGRPFYEHCVLHLQMLETQGHLEVSRPKDAPPLPPFEKWSFGLPLYLQYLADQFAVHSALENSISSLLGANSAHKSLRHFNQLGLQRADALAKDISALTNDGTVAPPPTTHAASYAGYLHSLSGRGGEGSSEVEKREAMCSLVAHFFCLHISHLTTIMRVGAKATEALGLFPKQAVNYYQVYPESVEDPLKTFIAGVNEVGNLLESQDIREEVKEQLANAMQKSSLLLATLAVEK